MPRGTGRVRCRGAEYHARSERRVTGSRRRTRLPALDHALVMMVAFMAVAIVGVPIMAVIMMVMVSTPREAEPIAVAAVRIGISGCIRVRLIGRYVVVRIRVIRIRCYVRVGRIGRADVDAPMYPRVRLNRAE